MNTEVWKSVKWDIDCYLISNFGRVKTLPRTVKRHGKMITMPERICKLTTDKKGYKTVRFTNNKKSKLFRVHRLVAEYFITNTHNKPFVNHIDGNPSNNHFTNLEWCTQQENIIHAVANGLLVNKLNNGASKKVAQIDMRNNEIIFTYQSCADAARQLNLKGNSISRCANGTRATAFGYKWKFI